MWSLRQMCTAALSAQSQARRPVLQLRRQVTVAKLNLGLAEIHKILV